MDFNRPIPIELRGHLPRMIAPSVLAALPAKAYLDPTTVGYEPRHHNEKRYQEGLALGRKAERVSISVRGVWAARGSRPGEDWHESSYETVGYHAGSASFWKGVVDSGCRIVVYRYDGKVTEHVIREGEGRDALPLHQPGWPIGPCAVGSRHQQGEPPALPRHAEGLRASHSRGTPEPPARPREHRPRGRIPSRAHLRQDPSTPAMVRSFPMRTHPAQNDNDLRLIRDVLRACLVSAFDLENRAGLPGASSLGKALHHALEAQDPLSSQRRYAFQRYAEERIDRARHYEEGPAAGVRNALLDELGSLEGKRGPFTPVGDIVRDPVRLVRVRTLLSSCRHDIEPFYLTSHVWSRVDHVARRSRLRPCDLHNLWVDASCIAILAYLENDAEGDPIALGLASLPQDATLPLPLEEVCHSHCA